jgi:hypothetical protein
MPEYDATYHNTARTRSTNRNLCFVFFGRSLIWVLRGLCSPPAAKVSVFLFLSNLMKKLQPTFFLVLLLKKGLPPLFRSFQKVLLPSRFFLPTKFYVLVCGDSSPPPLKVILPPHMTFRTFFRADRTSRAFSSKKDLSDPVRASASVFGSCGESYLVFLAWDRHCPSPAWSRGGLRVNSSTICKHKCWSSHTYTRQGRSCICPDHQHRPPCT